MAPAEKLGELHDLHISRETLRAWMVADGVWQTARFRSPQLMAELAKDHSPAWQSLGVSILHSIWEVVLALEDRIHSLQQHLPGCTLRHEALSSYSPRLSSYGRTIMHREHENGNFG